MTTDKPEHFGVKQAHGSGSCVERLEELEGSVAALLTTTQALESAVEIIALSLERSPVEELGEESLNAGQAGRAAHNILLGLCNLPAGTPAIKSE